MNAPKITSVIVSETTWLNPYRTHYTVCLGVRNDGKFGDRRFGAPEYFDGLREAKGRAKALAKEHGVRIDNRIPSDSRK